MFYSFTVPALGRSILMTFVAQTPSRAAARTRATELHSLGARTLDGLTAADRAAVVNFVVP